MASFDVVSIFKSIPPNLAGDVLRKRLEETYDESRGPLKIDHLMKLIVFCQINFLHILIAGLVLQELEKVAFEKLEHVFWCRYAGDTFVIIERSRLADFRNLPNGIFPDIQFTREEESARLLPFLDVLVTRRPNGELSTTVYRKRLT
ncbi:unnamed protein product [Dibothriocephalus latus]|uniref:Reverse transcriptase domain-containing protein n=1 Tax=Dibothriocephalus latus TaxID=60516 RepID=A0A3P7PXQ9_DIBLA|nr:unnamed protein product [Dibothriocephalus latus]